MRNLFFVHLLADKLFIVRWFIKPCHIRVFISFASTCFDHLRALRGWLIKTLIAQTMTTLTQIVVLPWSYFQFLSHSVDFLNLLVLKV